MALVRTKNRCLREILLVANLFFLANAQPVLAQAAGSLDALDANVVGSWVHATAVQPDGKTIISGGFTSVLGLPRNNIARINADGSLDLTFDPNANGEVNNIAVQADGKIILGGLFTTLQPNGAATATTRNRVARVNADGSLDMTFDPNANGRVYSAAVQRDGKILLGGQFTALRPNGAGSSTRNRIARVNSDGSLDLTFDPNVNGFVRTLALQADGRILIGGEFTSIQPNGAATATTRSYVARVNADGTLDTTFDPAPNNFVHCVAEQADEKILLGGSFTTLQPNGVVTSTVRGRIARVNSDGSLDMGFDPKANSTVYNVALQADGKVLFGGLFTTVQPNGAAITTARSRIARVDSDGSLDMGFDPKANNIVYNVALQADGKVLIGGLFTTVQPNGAAIATPRSLLARLNNDAAIHAVSASSPSQVQWLRSGAAPDVTQVTFEQSVNGGASWNPLGSASRVGITANWQLTGVLLATTGHLRARGQTTNGYQNSGSGLVEEVVSFGFPDIGVQQPLGSGLLDGDSSIAFGAASIGSSTSPKTFTIMNTGGADLTNLAVTIDGANPGDFALTAPVTTTVPPNQTTTFTVMFTPGGTVSASRTATIHVVSNMAGTKNPFDIALTGTGLSFATDTDGDAMNDASEFQMAALGFDWQVKQSAMVSLYYANANGAGLYTPAQVQALNVNVPLIQRNPTTGIFTLTIGVQKSTDLITFNPFPMTAPGTTVINGAGKLEFQFTVPDNAAFFRLQAQ
jgi:uncharacterized delta-60 repeat protein